MEFRILGMLEVADGGVAVPVLGAKPRALLAMFLLHPGQLLSTDRLADALWGGEPPPSADVTVRTHISRLRKALGSDVIRTGGHGYVLTVEPGDIDVWRFDQLADEGRAALAAGAPHRAAEQLGEALALWQGPPLAEFAFDVFAQPAIARLEEARLTALEDRVEAELALGRHSEVSGELRQLVGEHPLRERLWGQLMLALYRCGRQAEALRSFSELRAHLGDELGIEPSPALQRLEEAILLQKPELDWEPPAPARAAPGSGTPPHRREQLPLPPLLDRREALPFLGRQAELGALEDQLSRAATAGPLLVVLEGEPGVGKSRLAAELARRAHRHGVTVLAGRCDEDLAVPYQPFAEAFSLLVRAIPAAALPDRLGPRAGELVRLVPELADVAPDLPAPLRADAETARYRLFDAVTASLAAVAEAGPALLLLEDLHWAARPTLLLLRHVLTHAEPMPLLVVGTYRHTEHGVHNVVDELARHPGVSRVRMEGVDEATVGELLGAVSSRDLGDEGDALARSIHGETGGNPFFVGEIVRHLTETGTLLGADGRCVTDWRAQQPRMPEDVMGIVRWRLSRLPEPARRLLGVAAVIGPEYELALLDAATGLDPDDVLSSLDEAMHAGLVAEVPGPGLRQRFTHGLVRTALYEDLSGARRARLHLQVGEAMERVHARSLPEHLPELAHHFARAAEVGAADRAVAYAARAGDRALGQLAHDEAADYYRQALSMLGAAAPGGAGPDGADGAGRHSAGRHGAGRHGTAPAAGDASLRCDLLLGLGEAQRRCGAPEHRETLLAAARLAEELGDADRLARAALANNRGFWSVTRSVDAERVAVLQSALRAVGPDDSPVRARLLANLAGELVFATHLEETRRYSDEALAMARRLGDPVTLARVLVPRYNTLWGDPATLPERVANTIELVEVAAHLPDPMVSCVAQGWRGLAAMESGDAVEANRRFDEFERLALELRQPTVLWYATYCRAGRLQFAGHFADAARVSSEGLRVGQAAGQPDAKMFASCQRIQIYIETGRYAELNEVVRRGLAQLPGSAIFRSWQALAQCGLGREREAARSMTELAAADFAGLPLELTWLYVVTNWAQVCARLGDEVAAAKLLDLLEPFADQVVTLAALAYSGSVSHYLGLLAATLGRHQEAEARFACAAAVHERLGAPAWLARTQLEWARLLMAWGCRGAEDEAVHLLERARAAASALGLAAVEREAVSLLGAPPAPAPRGWNQSS